MRFRLFSVLFICFLGNPMLPAKCQTWVPGGYVGGQHWTKAQSPYYIMGDITVQKDSLLFIDPGVRVVFTGHYYLRVSMGCLRAEGVEGDSVVFTVQDTSGYYNRTFTGWNGIHVTGNCWPYITLLHHVVIEYARVESQGSQAAQGGGLYVIDCSNLHIIRSTIRNNLSISTSSTLTSAGADGGGLYLSNSPVVIEECVIRNNEAYARSTHLGSARGGGIFASESRCVLRNNRFYHNRALGESSEADWCQGGALYLFNPSYPVIENNLFEANLCPNHYGMGGAIYLLYGQARIVNNRFIENLVSADGGGIYTYTMLNFDLVNNLFIHNMTSGGDGGGLHLVSSGEVNITNCTFVNNTTLQFGGGIHADGGSELTLVNTILYGNSPSQLGFMNNGSHCTIRFSTLEGGAEGITVYDEFPSNFPYLGQYLDSDSLDPQFTDPSGWDFTLSGGSPSVNAGDPDTTGLMLPAVDLRGHPRLEHDIIDRGVYEYCFNHPPSDLALLPDTVPENLPAGTYAGIIQTSDPDPSDTFIYELTPVWGDPLDNALFTISGDSLLTACPFNHEQDSVMVVGIMSTDNHLNSFFKILNINITDVNDPPVLLHALPDQVVAAGQTTTLTLDPNAFYDEDEGDSLSYQLELTGLAELPPCINMQDSLMQVLFTMCNPTPDPLTCQLTACDRSQACAGDAFFISIRLADGEGPMILCPNPVSTSLHIIFPYQPDVPVYIDLYDPTGKKVRQLTIEHPGVSAAFLDLSNLSAGLYLIHLRTEDFSAFGKVLKVNE